MTTSAPTIKKKKCITCGDGAIAFVGDVCLKCYRENPSASTVKRTSVYVVGIHGDWYFDGGLESKNGRMPSRKGLGHAYRFKYLKSAIKKAIKYEGEVIELKEGIK